MDRPLGLGLLGSGLELGIGLSSFLTFTVSCGRQGDHAAGPRQRTVDSVSSLKRLSVTLTFESMTFKIPISTL